MGLRWALLVLRMLLVHVLGAWARWHLLNRLLNGLLRRNSESSCWGNSWGRFIVLGFSDNSGWDGLVLLRRWTTRLRRWTLGLGKRVLRAVWRHDVARSVVLRWCLELQSQIL